MYIKIQINPSELQGKDSAQLSFFFTKVAESSRLGYHKYFIEFKLAEWVSKNIILIDMHRERIIELGKSSATKGFDEETSAPFIEVAYGDYELSISKNKWHIGHIEFIGQNFHEQPILLMEGYSDIDFYDFLFEVEANRIGLGHLSFYALPTGGKANMKKGIDIHSKKSGIITCIFDSDLYVPEGKISNLFKDTVEFAEKHIPTICFITSTPGHEAENFIPLKFIHKVSGNNSSTSRELLKSLIDKPGQAVKGQCLSLFYDYKSGVSREKILRNGINEKQKRWVEEKYKIDLNKSYVIPIYSRNIYNFLKGKTIISGLPVYGKNIISDFINNEKVKSEFREFVNEQGERDWSELHSEWFEELLPYLIGENASVT